MRKIEVGGEYVALETFTDADERRAMADEWDEVPTVKTEVFWPVADAIASGPIPTAARK